MIALPPSGVATDSVLATAVAAGRGDLAHHFLGRPGVGAVPGDAAAGVVDDDLRALRRQQKGVRAAQSPAASGDDRDAVVESQVRHLISEDEAFEVAIFAPLDQQVIERVEAGRVELAEKRADALSTATAFVVVIARECRRLRMQNCRSRILGWS